MESWAIFLKVSSCCFKAAVWIMLALGSAFPSSSILFSYRCVLPPHFLNFRKGSFVFFTTMFMTATAYKFITFSLPFWKFPLQSNIILWPKVLCSCIDSVSPSLFWSVNMFSVFSMLRITLPVLFAFRCFLVCWNGLDVFYILLSEYKFVASYLKASWITVWCQNCSVIILVTVFYALMFGFCSYLQSFPVSIFANFVAIKP